MCALRAGSLAVGSVAAAYRDPVCGMRTDDEGSNVTHDGETYYFCSATCKRAFEETPGEFATVDPVISGGHDHH